MPLDLLRIDQAIQTARSERSRSYQQALRGYHVREQIHALFAEYPKRHRSFGRIKAKLGIFDGKDAELRDILYEMTARVARGEGDDQLWHLPEDAPRPVRPDRPRGPVLLIVLAIAAGLLLLFTLWEQIAGEPLRQTLTRVFGAQTTYQSFADCIEDKPDDKTVPEWRVHCLAQDF